MTCWMKHRLCLSSLTNSLPPTTHFHPQTFHPNQLHPHIVHRVRPRRFHPPCVGGVFVVSHWHKLLILLRKNQWQVQVYITVIFYIYLDCTFFLRGFGTKYFELCYTVTSLCASPRRLDFSSWEIRGMGTRLTANQKCYTTSIIFLQSVLPWFHCHVHACFLKWWKVYQAFIVFQWLNLVVFVSGEM